MKRILAGIAFGALLAFSVPAQAKSPFPVAVETRPISNFAIGTKQRQFGALEFIGGFEIRSREPAFGQLSALRFISPGDAFLGVADNGHWFSGKIERDASGAPTGIAGFTLQQMIGEDGRVLKRSEEHRV